MKKIEGKFRPITSWEARRALEILENQLKRKQAAEKEQTNQQGGTK